MKIYVYFSFRVAGMHFWPDAPEEHRYLSQPHRHEFHISGTKEVAHHDRDIEFIRLKHQIMDHLYATYRCSSVGLFLGRASCEDIAQELLDKFSLTSCTVLEDGENGAIIEEDR